MRKLLCILLLITSNALLAQKTEYSLQPQSGFFSFRGAYTAKETVFDPAPNDAGVYQDKHYGRIPEFSYSIEMAVKRVTVKQWIQGIGFSFESLQSKININKVYSWTVLNVTGNATLTNKFVTLSPFIGKRIATNNITVDILTGIDFAFCLSSYEKGQWQASVGNPYLIDGKIVKPDVDVRPRLQLTGFYKKIGLLLGYSHGITNYYDELARQDQKAFSHFLRIGIAYRLK